MVESFSNTSPDDLDVLKEAYLKVAPRPEDWPVLVKKVMTMAVKFPGWRPETIQAIQSPVLVIVGDRDIVRTEHAVELYRLLPVGQLAVVPNTDHVQLIVERTELLLSMINTFLNAQES